MALPISVIQRGTRAAQPAATTVADGTLYFVTDEAVTEQSSSGSWVTFTDDPTGLVTGPGSSTDNAIVRWNGTAGDTIQDSVVTIDDTTGVMTGARFPNTGLKVRDTDASHDLIIIPGSNITADRNLTITTGDAARTLTLPVIGTVGISIDGGGSAISTGVAGYVECPYAGTIVAVTLLADVSTSTVVDIWKDTYANYPPTDADSITASATPTISAALKAQDTTLTGWTTSVSAGDIFGFNVDSNDNATTLTLVLKIEKS